MIELEQIRTFFPKNIWPFRTNMLREYLQYKILESIFSSPHASKLAFMGGTCIHIIHGCPRFSEDIDFDNLRISEDDFEKLAKIIKNDMERDGYTVELKTVIKSAFRAKLRFPNILFESGLSGHRDQKMLIQIDMEPQRFEYEPDKRIISKFDVFTRINTVPADILLSQKLSCIFCRKRPMGRDFYDTLFLIGKTKANPDYLDEKLNIRSENDLVSKLRLRCRELDFKRLARDVEPFIFKKQDINRVLLFEEYIINLCTG
ncbi:MAG: nucleotidyl transferase AbiEii/AbiGii toxin family protein [Deltaproteobacteria bacterium]|nr:MAG: nucleotidyl transferase AbiEii/AbiGii toxin family protein [Deltaproteobacteria bacterium]